MSSMISRILKPAVTSLINPIAKALLHWGFTPNGVTILGAAGSVGAFLFLYPTGHLLMGSLIGFIFLLSDLFDGTMARLSNSGSSKWGGFLDSTLDRIADSCLLFGIILFLEKRSDPLLPIALLALVTGFLIPYIRAKAESLEITCGGGIAERTERLGIALTAIALAGLGVPFALAVGIWVLTILSVITVAQRIIIVRKALT